MGKTNRFKESILVLMAVFCVMNELNAQDWPNLERFRADNEKIALAKEGENRVVFMGNSITIGWIEKRPSFFKGKPYVNRGIGGQTTPQMLLRFRQDVLNLNPKVVVILAGTNDIARNTGPMSLQQILDNLISMAELATQNNIKVVLSSVLPVFDYPWSPGLSPNTKIPELNKLIKMYAEKNGHVYLDYFTAMADDRNGLPKKYAKDEVHPTTEGYMVMEPMVEKAISEALKN